MQKGKARLQQSMWTFALLDPADREGAVETIASLINKRTNLAAEFEELDNEGIGPNGNEGHRCTIEQIPCPKLQGAEDGHRMILHLALAMHCRANLLTLKDRMKALGGVSALETKTREWVREVVTCRRRFESFPPWILEVMAGTTAGEESDSDSDDPSLFEAKPMAT